MIAHLSESNTLDVRIYKKDVEAISKNSIFCETFGEREISVGLSLSENQRLIDIKPKKVIQLSFPFGKDEERILGYNISVNRKFFEDYVNGISQIEFLASRGFVHKIPLDRIHVVYYEDL